MIKLDEKKVEINFMESDKVQMSKVQPAVGDTGFFFITKDLETQTQNVYFQEFINTFRSVKHHVMALEENEAVAISLCNDQLQRKDMDYVCSREYNTKGDYTEWEEVMRYNVYYEGNVLLPYRANHLFILDTQGNVSKYRIDDSNGEYY